MKIVSLLQHYSKYLLNINLGNPYDLDVNSQWKFFIRGRVALVGLTCLLPSYFGLAMGLVFKSDPLTLVSPQTESSSPNSPRTTDAFIWDDPHQDE